MTVALALDIGGTKIEAALVDETGRIVEGSRGRVATGRAIDQAGLDQAIDRLVEGCRSHPRFREATAVGVGSAGPVDLAAGRIAPINLPLARNFAVVEHIRRSTGLENVTLRLDGTCIALAEAWLGAARGVANAIVMVVSTGVGGGIISGGRLIAGASGNAGHIGQLLIREASPSNLEVATVEGLASGPRAVEWAIAHGWTGQTGEDLGADAASGNDVARAAVARSAHAIGVGLANAATLLDLELAVVGGGFASVTPTYVEAVQRSARSSSVTRTPRGSS